MGMEGQTKTEKIIKIEEYHSKTKQPKYLWDIQTSGGGTYVLNGIVVHNSVIEFGAPAKPFTGDQVVHIRPHTKTMKSGKKVKVKGHNKVYHNSRLIRIRPKLAKREYGEKMWVVMHQLPERKPQLFLSRAFRKEIVHLKDDIAFYLKDIGKVSV